MAAGAGTAAGAAGRSLVCTAAATGFAGLATRFFCDGVGALRVAAFFAAGFFLAATAFLFLFAATLVALAGALLFVADGLLRAADFFPAAFFFRAAVDVFLLAAALPLRFALLARLALRALAAGFADFFAVLRCLDFDFFAMDHSAVSGCGFGGE
jgi:hypothetical protein